MNPKDVTGAPFRRDAEPPRTTRRQFLGVPLALGAAWTGSGRTLAAPTGRWRAGTGRIKITPEGPVWMAGYASRNEEGAGALHDLWAKAVAIEDPEGRRAVLIAADNCGAPRGIGDGVAAELQRRHGLPREAVMINYSHTHCGPVIEGLTLPFRELTAAQGERVAAYTRWFGAQLVEAADAALRNLAPANISWGTGQAVFAVNRRNNREPDVPRLRSEGRLAGPVDHDVPVLAVRDAGGRLQAVVFNYACHTTTLGVQEFNGDYAGFGQAEIERRHPGATAVFAAGCGGDINPVPRRKIELAQDYGRQLADAVDGALAGTMQPVAGRLRTALEYVPLAFASIPTRDQLQAALTSKERFEPLRARHLLAVLDRHGTIARSYPYPVQCWRLGGLSWIALGGEPVVEYALRLKAELGPNLWVMGYANDVLAYIPSERVLREGGYEGATAMVFFGHPSPWAPGLENTIAATAGRLVRG